MRGTSPALPVEGARGGAILQKLSKGATIVGLMVISGMSASMVALSTPLAMTIGETTFEMQSYLDQIFPVPALAAVRVPHVRLPQEGDEGDGHPAHDDCDRPGRRVLRIPRLREAI